MKVLKTLFRLIILGVLSSALMVIMFLLSENQIHRNNAFVRRYPHHPISKTYNLSLKYNSYYIAGYKNNILYLGNTTAPLHLLQVNLKTKDTQHIRIRLERKDFPFRSISIKLHPPYFFVMDGTIPCVFRGTMETWQARLWMKDKAYFTNATPIDSNTLYIKTISSKANNSILGIIKKRKDFEVKLNSNILEKQIDGMFDVDGSMIVSQDKKYLGYAYFYRNQFMVMNSSLELLHREKTIDTVSKAQIQLTPINKNGEVKMKAPPLEINKTATLYQNLIMFHSNRLGKYEERTMLNQASIIDVYNWKKQTYLFSFYIYNIHQKGVKEFNIYDNHLVAIIDNVLSVYQLKPAYFKKHTTI
ncbi:hypothetical protein [Thalassobellus citreus]|uniref:hypothetical protein n=1 Tax=Thalassobellus citreus TaxID=3367752 RepID=UPI00379C3520